ncbi:MAG TPA: TRAP transporter small permease [Candidatus Paceibacterota bacterium]|nr:TRAP transporter small permease [Candidatus Paceibacterota bacterium]
MSALTQALRMLVYYLAGIAGVSLLIMMLVTCADAVLRKFGHPVPGAYDVVKITAGVAMACGLPYTTAVKGHVAVEFFFHRLGHTGRIVVDTVIRLLLLLLFGLFAWQLMQYGTRLRTNGEVSMTLQLPVFWVPYLMAASCVVATLVTLYHLFHPGKALIQSR